MYSISEAAKKLGVSRQSIYNRLDKAELLEYVSETDKGKMLSDDGFEILKSLYTFKPDSQQCVSRQHDDNNLTDAGQQPDNQQHVSIQSGYSQQTVDGQLSDKYTDNYIISLEEQLDYLKIIISEKDKQISVKDEQILNLTRLTENSQILLKQKQDKNKLSLEAEETNRKRGFWCIFGKR